MEIVRRIGLVFAELVGGGYIVVGKPVGVEISEVDPRA